MSDKKDKILNDDLDLCKAASPSDCTGLIQVPPETEEEYESYNNIYNFAPHMKVNLRKNREDN